MGGLTLITPATGTPVTAAEAKAWCGVGDEQTDAFMVDLIGTAAELVEDALGRAMMPQVWRLSLDSFADPIVLPKGPVTAVASIKYDDPAGAEQTLPPETYAVDLVSDPQCIVLNAGQSWPVVAATPNPVRVEFTTGYETLPKRMKTGVLMTVASLYDDRTTGELPGAALDMLEPFRTGWFAA